VTIVGYGQSSYGSGGGPKREAPTTIREIPGDGRIIVGIPCNGSAQYPLLHLHLDWVEQTSGFDVTPCHDADGSWDPGPDCGGFHSGGSAGAGDWGGWCDGTSETGMCDTCGDPHGYEEPDSSDPEDSGETEDSDSVGGDEDEVAGGCGCAVGGGALGWLALIPVLATRRR
jgi:hypothetical protein